MSAPTLARETWRERAECGRVDPEMFDTPDARETGERWRQIRAARHALRLCARCPVIVWCRADATAVAPPVGVIRAGEVYDSYGRKASRCQVCRRPVLTAASAQACEDHGGLP